MATLGASFGADGAAVVSLQLVRLLLAILAVDVLLKKLGPKGEPEPEGESAPYPRKRGGKE